MSSAACAKDGRKYDAEFYADQLEGSRRSANALLARLFEVYRPPSVIDVGCGRGVWLSAAATLGCSELRGFDGDWVKETELVDDRICFSSVDLEKALTVGKRYGLCISVEVAEHLSGPRAKGYVRDLCSASDVVLFSAAIPGQGGTNHINERWQTEWVAEFAANGYECFDIFRGWAWRNQEVDFWYRQNAFLYVNRLSEVSIKRDQLRLMESPTHDVVHPELYEIKQSRLAASYESKMDRMRQAFDRQLSQPTLQLTITLLQRYAATKLRRLLTYPRESRSN